MSFNISYIFELQDKMSAKLQGIARTMQDTANKTRQQQEKIQSSFRSTEEQLNKMRGTVKNLAISFLGIHTIKSIASTLSNFETGLSGLRANIDGLTNDQFLALKNRALELGSTTEFTASQVVNGMVDLAKAGIQTKDIMQSVGDILDVATAAGVGFEQASSMLVGSVFALGKPMEMLGRIGDLTAKAANISNASFQEISMAIARGGSAAIEFNVGIEETYAAMATLTDSLQSGELAGSSFRAFLRELGVESKAGAAALAKYGLSYSEINPKTNQLKDIITKLQPLLQDTQAAFALLGDEGKRGAFILSSNTQKFIEQTEALRDSEGSAKKMAQIMRDNLGGSIKNMMSALEGFILQLGKSGLTQSLRDVIDGITSLIRVLSNPIFNNIIFTVGKIVAQVWLLKKALLFFGGSGAFKIIFWAVRMGGILPTLSFGILALRRGLIALAMANPFTALLTGSILFYELIKKIPDIMDKLYEKFTWVRNLGAGLSKLFGVDTTLNAEDRVQRPQNQSPLLNKTDLITQMVQGNIKQSASADINVNFGNMPQGASVQMQRPNVSWLNLGANTVSSGV